MSKKILVIEDNEQNLYLITFILEKHGYRVFPAHDGLAGIDLIDQVDPDLILLDIQLPGMNGYQVAEKLREIYGDQKVPIIAVTSYAMVGDKEKAFAAGCTGYVTKPINPDTIIPYIESFLA